jgi:hypothetical protein
MRRQVTREYPHGVLVAGQAVDEKHESRRLTCCFPNPQSPIVEIDLCCIIWVGHV